MSIELNLRYGLPEHADDSLIPISPDALDGYRNRTCTVHDLAELAFNNIPQDFPDARKEVGARLDRLAEDDTLEVYGPDEGLYYIQVPKRTHEQT